MQVFLKLNGKYMTLEATEHTRVSAIVGFLRERFSAQATNLMFIYAGKIIGTTDTPGVDEEDLTLEEWGIRNESTVEIIGRTRGGNVVVKPDDSEASRGYAMKLYLSDNTSLSVFSNYTLGNIKYLLREQRNWDPNTYYLDCSSPSDGLTTIIELPEIQGYSGSKRYIWIQPRP